MANNSASIVRNIVVSIFGIKPRTIKINRQLPEKFTIPQNYYNEWQDGEQWGNYFLHAWTAETGFQLVKGQKDLSEMIANQKTVFYVLISQIREVSSRGGVYSDETHKSCQIWQGEFRSTRVTE